jgi:hypothetical protein
MVDNRGPVLVTGAGGFRALVRELSGKRPGIATDSMGLDFAGLIRVAVTPGEIEDLALITQLTTEPVFALGLTMTAISLR